MRSLDLALVPFLCVMLLSAGCGVSSSCVDRVTKASPVRLKAPTVVTDEYILVELTLPPYTSGGFYPASFLKDGDDDSDFLVIDLPEQDVHTMCFRLVTGTPFKVAQATVAILTSEGLRDVTVTKDKEPSCQPYDLVWSERARLNSCHPR